MVERSRSADMAVLQRCIHGLRGGAASFGEALDIAEKLSQLRQRNALLEDGHALLEDVLRRAIELAERAAQPGDSHTSAVAPPTATLTPPTAALTPPGGRRATAGTDQGSSAREDGRVVRLASWNVKHLSDATVLGAAAKKEFKKLVSVLQHFDFVALQEITNATQTLRLLAQELPGRWDYFVSPKILQLNGRLCPECAAYFWRADRISCTGPTTGDGRCGGFHVTEGDTRTPACHFFHRPPFFSSFKAGDLEFVAMNAHGKPVTARCKLTRCC
jgi:hypothetical protein